MAKIGADVEQMGDMQRQFSLEADNAGQMLTNLDKLVHSTWWEGKGAVEFKGLWDTKFKSSLTELQRALTSVSDDLRNRVKALEDVT